MGYDERTELEGVQYYKLNANYKYNIPWYQNMTVECVGMMAGDYSMHSRCVQTGLWPRVQSDSGQVRLLKAAIIHTHTTYPTLRRHAVIQ